MAVEKPHQPLTYCRLPDPMPEEGEILIKISTCGVCRTDLHILDGELVPPHYPVIPGHQIVGEVAALGKGASRLSIGARVGVPWLGGCCFRCPYCLHDRENLCDAPVFTGFNRNGGYAEYCTANELFCFPLPDRYDDASAAPLLCAGLIGFRALRLCGDNLQRIGLLGFGASAHLVCQVCVQKGYDVYAFTREGDTEKQQFAESLGAVWSGSIEDPPSEPLDAVIIFASDGSLIPKSLPLLKKGGVAVCAGIHMSPIPAFEYKELWNERSIRSVANLTRADAVDFLDHAGRHPLKVETTLYPLREANRALDDLRHGKFNGSAVLRCS